MTATDNNSNPTYAMTPDDDSVAIAPLNFFAAEILLGDSPFMAPVLKLRDSISRNSDGNIVNYDAAVQRLKDEVDTLPTLELQQDVPAGAEGTYQRQLLHALEKINDDHDRVSRKLLKIKSRLMNALTLMKNQRSQFVAYYSLAYPTAVRNSNGTGQKMSVKGIENLASGEYSRIMDNLDSAAVSLISEITLLELEIKTSKAAANAKYALGKDQVNAMWTSFQSVGAIGLDDDPGALLKKSLVEEEDEDEVPSFVSRFTKEVRVGASISRPAPEQLGEIKGTFYKQGDPKPITPIVDDGDDGEIRTVAVTPVDEEHADSVKSDAGEWVEIKPDAAGLAAISELARKANDETMTEIKKTQEEKMKVLITAPEIPMEELISLRAHIDECDDDFSNEPLTVDYTAKWDDLQPATTKTLLIEDIEDSKPHSSQEASQLMEDAILGELDLPEFKPITGKVLTIAPDKIVPVDEFESIMNDPEPPPMATPAPTTPRKKLMILDEDEI